MSDESSSDLDHSRRKSFVADDKCIQETNDDAAESKLSAASMGYFVDPHITYFIRKPERKAPEINRGYYARVKIVRTLVDRFLKIVGPDAQIVNLGAGFDTLFWRLVDDKVKFRKFIEIDFSSITSKKIYHITKPHSPLINYIREGDSAIQQLEHRDLLSSKYCLLGADIRDSNELNSRLQLVTDIDYSLPTLFLAECVLVYMSDQHSSNLCRYLSAKFPTSCFVNYELVNLKDSFGDVFRQNMLTRGITLTGVETCESSERQIERFKGAGWPQVKSYLMTDVYNKFIDRSDRKRIESIEFFDEPELLTQLLEHYCVVVSVQDKAVIGLERIFF